MVGRTISEAHILSLAYLKRRDFTIRFDRIRHLALTKKQVKTDVKLLEVRKECPVVSTPILLKLILSTGTSLEPIFSLYIFNGK